MPFSTRAAQAFATASAAAAVALKELMLKIPRTTLHRIRNSSCFSTAIFSPSRAASTSPYKHQSKNQSKAQSKNNQMQKKRVKQCTNKHKEVRALVAVRKKIHSC
jgi:hypothetical protein